MQPGPCIQGTGVFVPDPQPDRRRLSDPVRPGEESRGVLHTGFSAPFSGRFTYGSGSESRATKISVLPGVGMDRGPRAILGSWLVLRLSSQTEPDCLGG